MAECLVIKAPDTVSDYSLRKLGEFIFKIIPIGDNSGFTKVKAIIKTTGSIKVSIDNGTIHKTKTDNGVQELTFNGATTWGLAEFYIKSNGVEGLLHFEDARNITQMGAGWNDLFFTRENNSPTLKMTLSSDIKSLTGLSSIYAPSGLLNGLIDNITMFPSLGLLTYNYDVNMIGNIENITSSKLKTIEMVQCGVSGDIAKLFKNCPLLSSLTIGWDKTVYNGKGEKLTDTKLKVFEYKTYQPNTASVRTFGNLIKALSLCEYETGSAVRIAGSEVSLSSDEQEALTVLKGKTTVTITNG